MNSSEMQEYKNYLKTQGFNDGEADEYIQHAMAQSPTQESSPKQPGVMSKAIDYGLRALDYAGGLTRTAAADALLSQDQVTAEDYKKALKGQAPGSEEYLKRGGVEEGNKYNLFPEMTIPFTDVTLGKGDTSERDLVGMVGDIALDPLTYLSFGATAAAKGLKPVSALTKNAGKSIYKSGLKKIDQEVMKYGKEPVSDVLMQYKIAGSPQKIARKMDDLGVQLLDERNKILKQATKAGAEVSMNEAMSPTMQRIAEIRSSNDPALQPLADALEQQVSKYKALEAIEPQQIIRELPVKSTYTPEYRSINGYSLPKQSVRELPVQGRFDSYTNEFIPGKKVTVIDEIPGSVSYGKIFEPSYTLNSAQAIIDMTEKKMGPTPMMATGYKSSLASMLPESAFRDPVFYGKVKSAEKDLSIGMKGAVESSVNKSLGPETEAMLKQKNDYLGRILTSKEKQFQEAAKEANKNIFTSVDAPLTVANPWMAAAKKAADIAKMPAARTYVGRGMVDLANTGVLDPLVRQMLIQNNQNQTPWDKEQVY